eukprot:PhM_4_TR11492/c0_g1_i1/m.5951/K01869/LARS, leuS; leucyl-tRNA synthetase
MTSVGRKDQIRAIEQQVGKVWERLKPFETDAPAGGKWESNDNKYLITFPYPYMNGKLHLGHAFSLTKSEFAAGYHRLKGKRVLWPFGLHATGMPIAACAKKLTMEIEKYGLPPVFPKRTDDDAPAPKEKSTEPKTKFQSKKGKKAPASKPQWEIMEEMKVDEIEKFRDPLHWLRVFPPAAIEDLKLFGCRVDYRRSFVTTELNPYYDSFIRWQFHWLRKGNKIAFGKRYTIFSPLDGQPCQDHDRASGEGVQPQEYTLIKMQVIDPVKHKAFEAHSAAIGDKKVFLAAATLRPETMVGQTNCWISPNVTYAGFDVDGEIIVMTKRSASNLAHQDKTVSDALFEVEGKDMMGVPLNAPYAPFPVVYTLPMDTISETKGTGIVTSVPSDSPDDYINLMALKNKPEYRAKLGLDDSWVVPFDVIPILNIPNSELGDCGAEVACKKFGVQGPKDSDRLTEAKQLTYKEGFYNGIMTRGPYASKPVSEAKVLMRAQMIADGQALAYCEPDGLVMSRSGDECVVALVDQWYLKYGEESWRNAVAKHLATMETYNSSIRNGFEETLAWLGDWACSRTFGLGTRLPYENTEQYLIDSLSDSTIYMAYYTIAHMLHGTDNIDGSRPAPEYNIPADALTMEVWDYIFLGHKMPETCSIPKETLEKLRNEFLYWYPVDLRVSGKDLIQNHLTMFLYNHAAVWENDTSKWPKSIYCNGHILIEKKKMSKSLGNFRTLRDAVDEYSADGCRLALADAGDSLDDPNFVPGNAIAFTSKLGVALDFCEEYSKKTDLRSGEYTLFDRIFDNEITAAIVAADAGYSKMQFRQALHAAFFELTNARDEWKVYCGAQGLHRDIVQRYIDVQCRILAPICPHVCDYIFQTCVPAYPGKPESLMLEGEMWPKAPALDAGLRLVKKLIHDTLNDIRGQYQKAIKKAPKTNKVTIFAASGYTSWQVKALQIAHEGQSEIFNVVGDTKAFAPKFKQDKEIASKMPEALSFLAYVRDNEISHNIAKLEPLVDDYAILKDLVPVLSEQSKLPHVEVVARDTVDSTSPQFTTAQKSRTSQPSIHLSTVE